MLLVLQIGGLFERVGSGVVSGDVGRVSETKRRETTVWVLEWVLMCVDRRRR